MPNNINLKSDLEAMSLIRLFATHSISKIEQDPPLIRDLFLHIDDVDTNGTPAEVNDRILDRAGYNSFYITVKELKKSIETILSGSSELAQVRGILKKLELIREQSLVYPQKVGIFKTLVDTAISEAGLWKNNNAAILKYREGASMITEWVDFFLSYTNRNQPEVNNIFKPVLKDKFSEDEWKNNVNALNLIAKLLVRYIKERTTLNVIFYDKQSMVCGDNIQDKVELFCKNTFAFAQLFQWQIITYDGKNRNWCHFEYETFSENNKDGEKKEFYFKVYDVPDDAEEAVNAAPNDQNWRNWLRSALSKKQIVLNMDMDFNILREECRKIGLIIRENRQTIINNYLQAII